MKKVGVRSGLVEGAAPRLPELDGSPARLGGSPNANEKPAYCSLCGAAGHSASKHMGGKAVLDPEPSGEAIDQDRATQFGVNDSPLTTGNANYKSPGSAGGMT